MNHKPKIRTEDDTTNTTIPKIALGAWSWGAGAAGEDQVFGNHLAEADLQRYNEAHPFPAGTGRGDAYNPHLKELSALIEELSMIGTRLNASPAQVATAWAISKGTLPIIGVTKVKQVEEAAQAAQITLTEEEICRLEKLGDETGVHTLREWEKEML